MEIIIVLILVTIILLRELRYNQSQQRKRDFIAYYCSISWELASLRDKIVSYHKKYSRINPTDSFYLEIEEIVEKYLDHMENLAVAINLGLYDFKTYVRLEGILAKKIFMSLMSVINFQRQDGRAHVLRDYIELMGKIKEN